MALFWKLHEEKGITLIIVTHDPDVAAQTQRVIALRDGLVVADEWKVRPNGGGPAAAPKAVEAQASVSEEVRP